VEQTAAGLLAVGLKRGDRLGIWGPNIYEWILMQFATAKAGIILVSVFVESCNLVYPRISQWLVSHQVYWDFTGFSEPGLSTARGRICTQKGKLMFIHAKKEKWNVPIYRTV